MRNEKWENRQSVVYRRNGKDEQTKTERQQKLITSSKNSIRLPVPRCKMQNHSQRIIQQYEIPPPPHRPIEPGGTYARSLSPDPPPPPLSRVFVSIGNYKKHPLFPAASIHFSDWGGGGQKLEKCPKKKNSVLQSATAKIKICVCLVVFLC